MKNKFTIFKAIMMAIIMGSGITTFAQPANLFLSFSNATENAFIGTEGTQGGTYSINDGHLFATGELVGSTYRRDFEYSFNSAPHTFTMNPLEDVYFAIKFVGEIPQGIPVMQTYFDFFLHEELSGTIVANFNARNDGPATLFSYVTPAGNEILYFKISDSPNSPVWADLETTAQAGVDLGDPVSDYDETMRRLEFKYRAAPFDFEWSIDWVATFTTITDIEAYAESADDIDDGATVDYDDSDLTISSDITPLGGFFANSLTVNSNATLTVGAGEIVSVTGDVNTAAGSIVVESGGSLMTYDGAAVGDVTINRNTSGTGLAYSFVGTPVAADASITGADLGAVTYYYDETEAYSAAGGARWKDANAMQLTPGVGYAQAGQGSISFTGVPNDGTITVSGLTYSSGTASEQGWNMLSNPYAAPIDAEVFFTENDGLDAALYLWDDNNSTTAGSNTDYLTVTALGTAASGPNGGSYNGLIGSMQGFFVKVATEGSTDAIFTEDMRSGNSIADGNGDASFFRVVDEKAINLKLAIADGNGLYNETLIGLRNDATLGMDRGYDASKLIANQALQLYSLTNDDKYAIQALPREAGISTELAFDLGETSSLKLSVIDMTGVEGDLTFFITDNVTGEIYDLSVTNSFDFTSSAGSDQNRFTLSYGASDILSTSTLELDRPIYKYLNDELTVSFNQSTEINGFTLYDQSGKILIDRSELNQSLNELVIPIGQKGINILKIRTDGGNTVNRKFLF